MWQVRNKKNHGKIKKTKKTKFKKLSMVIRYIILKIKIRFIFELIFYFKIPQCPFARADSVYVL
jgi:hypothetical protein